MNKIEAINNFEDNTWEIVTSSVLNSTINLLIGFKDKGKEVYFDDLSFGFDIKYENNLILNMGYPKNGTTYLSTDNTQQFLEGETFDLEKNKEYDLRVWSQNSGILTEKTIKIHINN